MNNGWPRVLLCCSVPLPRESQCHLCTRTSCRGVLHKPQLEPGMTFSQDHKIKLTVRPIPGLKVLAKGNLIKVTRGSSFAGDIYGLPGSQPISPKKHSLRAFCEVSGCERDASSKTQSAQNRGTSPKRALVFLTEGRNHSASRLMCLSQKR